MIWNAPHSHESGIFPRSSGTSSEASEPPVAQSVGKVQRTIRQFSPNSNDTRNSGTDVATKRPHVVIIGAGFGGLAAAKGLRHADVDVTVVDQRNHHIFQPLLYQVATAGLSPADIAAPIRAILKDITSCRVILDRVVGVDPDWQAVMLETGGRLTYDWLILATGARHSYFGRDDWAKHAPGIKTIEDATEVRHRVLLAMERAETENDKARRDALLTFVVIGAGPTGVEMAGAIAELARQSVSREFRSITPYCSRIYLIEAGPRILPSFPSALSERAEASIRELGVEVLTGFGVEDVSERGVRVGENTIAGAHDCLGGRCKSLARCRLARCGAGSRRQGSGRCRSPSCR